MGRKRANAGRRASWHDYRSRCQYHVILNKRPGCPDFSHVAGILDSHQWPPCTVNHPLGEIISQAFRLLKENYPFIWIRRRCIMPDHLHFAIFIRKSTPTHLGDIIAQFKIHCSILAEREGFPPGIKFFTDNYYDVVLRKEGQLKRMLDYISDNPRRWLVRKQHPGFFHRFSVAIAGRSYEAYGNWDLLAEPDHEAVSSEIEAVKVSSKYREEELTARKRSWKRTVENDGILVSPFIHEEEKRVRDWAVENGGAIILLRAEPFGEVYKPGGRWFDLCQEGRLLEVYVPLEGEAEEEYMRREKKPPRSACQRMNALAEAIAAGS